MTTIPNFFMVGASKAGTTSVAQALAEHPDIFMTQPKEPNFFNTFDNADRIDPEAMGEYLRRYYDGVRGEAVVGEASVSSLVSKRAAYHIRKHNPAAKILVCLRNPVHRIVSLYEMYVRHGLKESFEHITVVDPWLLNQCYYYERVKRYIDLFPREQVMFVAFDDIKSDWEATLQAIHEFLGVSPEVTGKPVVRNTGGMPGGSMAALLTNRKLIEFGKAVIPARWRNSVDRKIKSAAYKKMTLTSEQEQYFRERFAPDIEKLDAMLDTRYTTRWGLGETQRVG